MGSIRTKLVTAAAVVAAAAGAAAIANAATSGTASSSSSAASGSAQTRDHDPSEGGHTLDGKTEKLLSGDVASKVRAAALAKVSGTVERVETNVDSSAALRGAHPQGRWHRGGGHGQQRLHRRRRQRDGRAAPVAATAPRFGGARRSTSTI